MAATPRFSVIVPCPDLSPLPKVLADLTKIAEARHDLEILLATGANPSRQRNLAVAQARGEIVIFLDSDCRVESSHFEKILAHFFEGRRVIGAPVHLEFPAGSKEILFQSFFSHPAVAGPSSARYRSSGGLRQCNDAGLILCNMAVWRETFLASGGFDERLYPNEENEWMARLQIEGHILWHDPDLAVRRPQRKNWREFARTLIGYGKGRTRQARVSGRWDLLRQLPTLGLILFLLAFVIKPIQTLLVGLMGWLGYAAVVRLAPTSGPQISLAAALQAPTLPLLYAVGQILGIFESTKERHPGDVRVYRWANGALEEVGLPTPNCRIGRGTGFSVLPSEASL